MTAYTNKVYIYYTIKMKEKFLMMIVHIDQPKKNMNIPSTAPVYPTKHVFPSLSPSKRTYYSPKSQLIRRMVREYPEYGRLINEHQQLVNDIQNIEKELYCRGKLTTVGDGIYTLDSELFYRDPAVPIPSNLPLPGLEWLREECLKLTLPGTKELPRWVTNENARRKKGLLNGTAIYNIVFAAVTGTKPRLSISRARNEQSDHLEWSILAAKYNFLYMGHDSLIVDLFLNQKLYLSSMALNITIFLEMNVS